MNISLSKAMEMSVPYQSACRKKCALLGVDSRVAIASMSRPVAMLAKECVNRAFESSLAEGILYERRIYHACFSLSGQTEAMRAFVEKRRPELTNS